MNSTNWLDEYGKRLLGIFAVLTTSLIIGSFAWALSIDRQMSRLNSGIELVNSQLSVLLTTTQRQENQIERLQTKVVSLESTEPSHQDTARTLRGLERRIIRLEVMNE